MYPSSDTERLGAAAGVVVTVMSIGLLFVGPWRVFAVESGGMFPITEVENSEGSPFGVGAVGILFVAFVTGAAYPHVVEPTAEEHEWGDLAMSIFVPPLVTVLLGFLALLLAPAVESLFAGAVADAAAQAVVGIIMAAVFAGLVGTVLAIVVGVPAVAGVWAGVLVGSAAAPN